jgi:RNase P subunit RPR2
MGIFSKKTKSKTSQSAFLVVKCNSCGKKFKIGLDAAVHTYESWAGGKWPDNTAGRDIWEVQKTSSEAKGRPDSIASVNLKNFSKDSPSMKLWSRELQKVKNSFRRGEKRSWECGECGSIQTYPKDAIG